MITHRWNRGCTLQPQEAHKHPLLPWSRRQNGHSETGTAKSHPIPNDPVGVSTKIVKLVMGWEVEVRLPIIIASRYESLRRREQSGCGSPPRAGHKHAQARGLVSRLG